MIYLGVEHRHNSVFGFSHVLPLPAHLDVWICKESQEEEELVCDDEAQR